MTSLHFYFNQAKYRILILKPTINNPTSIINVRVGILLQT